MTRHELSAMEKPLRILRGDSKVADVAEAADISCGSLHVAECGDGMGLKVLGGLAEAYSETPETIRAMFLETKANRDAMLERVAVAEYRKAMLAESVEQTRLLTRLLAAILKRTETPEQGG